MNTRLPYTQPMVANLVEAGRKQKLFLRDVASMGKCFDQRTLRIAVKDRKTNLRMLQILHNGLSKMGAERILEERTIL
jgi:histidinol-phosphate/aromatic aminotransferase/cobyric acid decarboxylase-like protein